MFLPTTPTEVKKLGWNQLDIILVSGDSYIDSPLIGAAVIGKILLKGGYRVGIVAQPDTSSLNDIGRLGEPALFWGVTAGSIDSMVANYTALKKKRKRDDYTPGGENARRPDRATIVYTNLIRRFSKTLGKEHKIRPIVLGGIEASLRRVAHYDYWSDKIRGSLLFDSKADYILYGMAEKSILEFAAAIKNQEDPKNLRGLCYISKEKPGNPDDREFIELPSFDVVSSNKPASVEMFKAFYSNNDPISAKGLYQKHGNRFLVQNPPTPSPTQLELDAIYSLNYERAQHPYYEKQGSVKALETIRFSISTHRGCYGECNFCAIAMHEGRTVLWRSQESIIKEAQALTHHPDFKGYVQDLCGPTANMYGFECQKKTEKGPCPNKRCLFPKPCHGLEINHQHHLDLLKNVRQVKGIKKAFVASGIRYDLLFADREHLEKYMQELVEHHVSGQMKVAPEHTEPEVLNLMGKPGTKSLLEFRERFNQISKSLGKKQFLTYYFIAAHPGCTREHMFKLKSFVKQNLQMNPEQVQIFTPTPSTWSSVMYYTGMDPFTGQKIFVEKDMKKKEGQKSIIDNGAWHQTGNFKRF